jgi:hypothetical protein
MKINIPNNNNHNIIFKIFSKWKEEFNVDLTYSDSENILINDNIILYPYEKHKNFKSIQKVIHTNLPNSKWCYFNKNSMDLDYHNIDDSYSFENRNIKTIFHGKINSEEKIKIRSKNWSKNIENFSLEFEEFSLSQNDYIDLLKKSIFGICLKGDSKRSSHLLDYLALGVIPLITSDIDISFYDNLIKGLHYFNIESPEDIKEIVENTNKEHLILMSNECKKWYRNNCSISGSYKNLLLLIDKIKSSNQDIELQNSEEIITDKSVENISNENISNENQINSIVIIEKDYNIYNSIKNNINIPIITNTHNYDDNNIIVIDNNNKYELIKYAINNYGNTLFLSNNYIIKDKLPKIDNFKEVGLKKKNGSYHLDCIFLKNLKVLDWIMSNEENLNRINIYFDIFLISDKIVSEYKNYNVNLLINYINDKNRENEFIKCIQKNISNTYLNKIYCFLNKNIDPPKILDNKKIIKINIDRDDINFKDIVEYVNKNLDNNINILCNSDIYLENKDWSTCVLDDNLVLCQSAYIVDSNYKILNDLHINTIEGCNKLKAFIFKNKIKMMDDIKLGYDNNEILITKLLKENNYNILNLPSEHKIYNLNEKSMVYIDKSYENKDYYLLPNFSIVNLSFNEILSILKLDDKQKYKTICELFTKYIKIQN